ncbi:MAG: GNAT family N-acetyltransferase [Saprospiraceae bacterium]
MFLRPFRPADKRNLQQLFYETVHALNVRDYPPEYLNALAPEVPNRTLWAKLDAQTCFVVEYQKTVVGFASLSEEAAVDFLFVHKDFQGRRIATTLLKQLERVARKKGFTILVVEASFSASGFFEKLGFTVVSKTTKQANRVEIQNFKMEKAFPQPATNNT